LELFFGVATTRGEMAVAAVAAAASPVCGVPQLAVAKTACVTGARANLSFASTQIARMGASCTFFDSGREMLIISSRPVQRQQRGGKVICGLFGLGLPELVVIAGVVAFLFGPKNLPDLGRSLGKTVRSFSQAAKEFESEMKSSANEFQAEVAGTSRETTAGESPNVEPPVTSSSGSSRNPSSTSEKGSS
jgi:sec-independent protein translocase protein TatA